MEITDISDDIVFDLNLSATQLSTKHQRKGKRGLLVVSLWLGASK
jgi:hypothetical protein